MARAVVFTEVPAHVRPAIERRQAAETARDLDHLLERATWSRWCAAWPPGCARSRPRSFQGRRATPPRKAPRQGIGGGLIFLEKGLSAGCNCDILCIVKRPRCGRGGITRHNAALDDGAAANLVLQCRFRRLCAENLSVSTARDYPPPGGRVSARRDHPVWLTCLGRARRGQRPGLARRRTPQRPPASQACRTCLSVFARPERAERHPGEDPC
jgi:hypothetical protein